MSKEDIADLVRSALISVAPEVESQTLDPDADFRDQMDLDSMDFLNFVITLHEATEIDIPEKDYIRGRVRWPDPRERCPNPRGISRNALRRRPALLEPSVRSLIDIVGAPILLLRPEQPSSGPTHVVLEPGTETRKLLAAVVMAGGPADRPIVTAWIQSVLSRVRRPTTSPEQRPWSGCGASRVRKASKR